MLRRFARRILPVVVGVVIAVVVIGWLAGWSTLSQFAGALGAAGAGSLVLGVLSLVGNSYRSCANTAQTGDRSRFFVVAVCVGAVCLVLAWALAQVGG